MPFDFLVHVSLLVKYFHIFSFYWEMMSLGNVFEIPIHNLYFFELVIFLKMMLIPKSVYDSWYAAYLQIECVIYILFQMLAEHWIYILN